MGLWARSKRDTGKTASNKDRKPDRKPVAGDPGLPGTSGYGQIRPGRSGMPNRFTFVRPDGKPDPKRSRGRRGA